MPLLGLSQVVDYWNALPYGPVVDLQEVYSELFILVENGRVCGYIRPYGCGYIFTATREMPDEFLNYFNRVLVG